MMTPWQLQAIVLRVRMANGLLHGSQIFGSDTLGVDRITLSLHTWE